MKLILLNLFILISTCEIKPDFWYSAQKNELEAQLTALQKQYETQITKIDLTRDIEDLLEDLNQVLGN